MCPPLIAVAAVVSAAAAAAGAGVQVAGNIKQGKAAAASADAQADQDVRNAHLAHEAELDVLRRGSIDAGKARAEGQQVIAEQRLGFTASGVDVGSGTALDVQGDTRELSEFQAAEIEVAAARDAWGYRTKGINYQEQAKVTREVGRQQREGTFLTAVGQGISGVGAAASAFSRVGR
jgi:hypothetical protein